MCSLLQEIIDAHGGLRRWQALSDLVTEVEVEGQMFPWVPPQYSIPHSRIFFSLRRQHIVMLTDAGNLRFLIEPNLVSVFGERDAKLEVIRREEPVSWFWGGDGSWDLLRTAYVQGFGIRRCVTAPFLYTTPGFITEEVEPWEEDGEIWRVLKISFPSRIEVGARVQYEYFGSDGFLRRTRYSLNIPGFHDFVNYVCAYKNVDGIWLPTARQVFACDLAGRKRPDRMVAQSRLKNPFFS